MKRLLVFCLLILSVSATAQKKGGIATLDAKYFGGNDLDLLAGVTMSGAGILKDPEQKGDKGVLLGAGTGIFVIKDGGDPYIPLFIELGYFNRVAKVSPYINVRGGWGFYKDGLVKGGFYSEFRGGACFKVGICRFTPYAALSMVQLSYPSLSNKKNETLGIFTTGIAFVFAR